MFGMVKKKRQRFSPNAFVLVSAAAVVLAGYFWILAPHVGYLSASKKRLSVVKELRQKHDFLKNLVSARQKQMQNLHEKLTDSRVCDSLFAPSDAASFFDDIQAVAEASRCVIESLNFAPNTVKPTEGRAWEDGYVIPEYATVVVVGPYSGAVEFMNRLQDRLEKVWIDSLEIEPVRDEPGKLRCSFTVTVYVMHECESVNE